MFWQYVNDGVPMLKPLVYFDQNDTQTHYRTDEFIFGNQILVCPILEPNAQGRRMYLPKGKWYNFWTNEVVDGKKELWINTAFDEIPIFVLEGSIIPKYPVQQYVGEKEIEQLELDVYYKFGKEKSFVYEDAMDGYDYNKGRYSFKTFSFVGKEKEVSIFLHKEGTFETKYNTFKINLKGFPFKIKRIEVDGEKIVFDKETISSENTFEVYKDFTELCIKGS
jgi:alpha-glucosidase